MPETPDELAARLQKLIEPGARGQLVAKGLARGMIWRDGELPADAPDFGSQLTPDLLDHGYATLALALRLRATGQHESVAMNACRVSAEAIEAAARRGNASDVSRGFHLTVAAAAFHIARFAARAYCLLADDLERLNLSSSERILVLLMRRRLRDLRQACVAWLNSPAHSDDAAVERLTQEEDFDVEDVLSLALSRNFHRALAFFDWAIQTGTDALFDDAIGLLDQGIEAAAESNFVPHWWVNTLARHLIDDLWNQSLHVQLPLLPDSGDGPQWNNLRGSYIASLCARDLSEIDLWPSQTAAAARATDPDDDLVVGLPTSAGKTRIAELCILRALASSRRVVYVTPLRALSAQLEAALGRTFGPLGISVSSLYGASGVTVADVDTLRSAQIVVATPEKLDFAIRQDPTVIEDVALIVLDEGHMIGLGTREVFDYRPTAGNGNGRGQRSVRLMNSRASRDR